MLRDPDKQVMQKAYARWAPVYDVLCGPVFVNGRRAARAVGGRILEIGVGTGLSFDDYDGTTARLQTARAFAEHALGVRHQRDDELPDHA